MPHQLLYKFAPALLVGAALFALDRSALSLSRPTTPPHPPTGARPRPSPPMDRKPHPACPDRQSRSRRADTPCLPPYPHRSRARAVAERNFEVRIVVVDADPAALPAVSAALLRSSNSDDQFVALQTQANLQVSDGPTLHIQQDGTDTGESDAARIRVSAHPHLNADGAEAVDITVEQVPAGTPWAGEGSPASLVFTNGETRLVSDTLRPDGRRHLLYATVFFPAGATKACARPSEEPPIPLMH